MPQQANQIIRPRAGEQPLYPFPVLEDYEIRPGEIRTVGGFALARTEEGWRVVDKVDLRGVVETDD